MRAISNAFANKLYKNTTLLARAQLTLADGTVKQLTGDDLVSMECEQSTSGSDEFEVGAAVIGKLDVTLNNHDGRFDTYDFDGSTIKPYIGLSLEGGEEWILLGTYHTDQPDAFGGTIDLTALDNMSLLEREYAEVKTSYPATLSVIVKDICAKCGVTLATASFANSGYSVARRPESDSLSCIDVVGFAAQVSGNYARVDEQGRLHLDWYATDSFDSEDWLDGERFDDATPYASGDTADGGSFDNYASGDSANGGSFDESRGWSHIYATTSLRVNTDDVQITGIQVTAENEVVRNSEGYDENGRDGETALSGKDGYVIRIEDNPLVCYGQASKVASMIAARVVGMRFRPFSATCITDPAIEAGDTVIITDRKQNTYRSLATTVKLKVNAAMSVSCDAKSKSAAAAVRSTATDRVEDNAHEEVMREQESREALGAKLEVTAGQIRAEVADKASRSELRQTANEISSTVEEKVSTAKSEAINSANSYTSTRVTQTARDLTVQINSAKSIANDAQDTADAAKNITDKFIFSSSGLQIQGTYGGKQSVATYTSTGFTINTEQVEMGSAEGRLAIKNWGWYYESNNGSHFWQTDGERYGGGYHTHFDGTGYNFSVNKDGVYWNGNRLATESQLPSSS